MSAIAIDPRISARDIRNMMRWYTVLSFECDRRMATIRSIEATADKDPVTRGAIAPNGVWYGRFGDDDMVSSISMLYSNGV